MVKIQFPKPLFLKREELENICNCEDDSELAQSLRKEWSTNGAYFNITQGNYFLYLEGKKLGRFMDKLKHAHEATKNSKLIFGADSNYNPNEVKEVPYTA